MPAATMASGRDSTCSARAIYHITHMGAGSKWIQRILSVICPVGCEMPIPHTEENPCECADGHENAIFSPVCLPPRVLDTMNAFPEYDHFVVIRDLRDTLVSLYFGLLHTDDVALIERAHMRKMLQRFRKEDGLIWCMDQLLYRTSSIQRGWIERGEPVLRYEDLLERDGELLESALIDRCGLPVERATLRRAIQESRFERLTGRPRGCEDVASRLRKGIVGDWRNHFSDHVKAEFKRRFAETLIVTGYEHDASW